MKGKMAPVLALGIAIAVMLTSCTGNPAIAFDGQKAYEHVLAQCDLGPRPSGSTAILATYNYIASKLKEQGWELRSQHFLYGGIKARNLMAKKGKGPVVMLGAHYDTRPIADKDPNNPDQPVLGANDGASGVAVLLELARCLEENKLKNTVILTFFDAEDRGHIDGWPFCVGSEYLAANLNFTPEYIIVVDMVGDAKQELYWEGNSDPVLLERIWDIAAELGYKMSFIPTYKWRITDDHTPFLKRGIPAIDIIDFDYPYWHTTEDTPDKVSPESLERVGRVLEVFLEEKQ